jgi:hypothetical protein
MFSTSQNIGLNCVPNDVSYGGYVEDSRSDLQCRKTVGIKVLCGVYSVGLSCARSKLLKFKFAQGLYVHPVCVCVCVCVCELCTQHV